MDFQGGGIILNPFFFFSQSRLRKQDVGLKTHLQQLDQQISELKLDVNKASTDQMESDSRPSSGVYSHTQANPYSLIESKKYSFEALSSDAYILNKNLY